MAFYLNCPVFAKALGPSASKLEPSVSHSTNFTHLYYLPFTVAVATDEDKSLTIFKWKRGMTTIVGKSV